MKQVLIAALAIGAAVTSATARVGETQQEITARYGAGPLSDLQRQAGAETFIYRKENFQIEVVMSEGKSVWEIIQRQDGDRVITDDEIKNILNGYKDAGRTWFFDKRDKRWIRSGQPKYIAYRWPGHEDYLCIKDQAACEALEKKNKSSKGL